MKECCRKEVVRLLRRILDEPDTPPRILDWFPQCWTYVGGEFHLIAPVVDGMTIWDEECKEHVVESVSLLGEIGGPRAFSKTCKLDMTKCYDTLKAATAALKGRK